jgi:hypothetical protein
MSKISSDQAYGYNRDFWVLADNTSHPVLSSDHFILGTSFVKKCLSLEIEGYYKTIRGLQKILITPENPSYIDPNENANEPVNNIPNPFPGILITGNSKAYGIDFLIKYESTYFTSLASYSIGKAIQNFNLINNNANIPAPFDQSHSFNWSNMLSFNNWNLSAVYTYSTGHPYISNTLIDEDHKTIYLYKRLPDYSRFDIALNYNFHIKKVCFKAGISIINLFNRQNYYDIDRRRFSIENLNIEQTSIIKSQGLTPNIYINFRF